MLSDRRASWINPNAPVYGPKNLESPGLDDLIGSLPFRQREILHLRYGESLKIREISELLGVSSGTVKSRLFHATQKLKSRLLRNRDSDLGPDKEKSRDM